MLPIIFIVPVVQLFVFVYTATLELKNVDVYIVDKDVSSVSRRLINKFIYSPFFTVRQTGKSVKEGEAQMFRNKAALVVNIPNGFEKDLLNGNSDVQLLINGINNLSAGLINAYSSSLIRDMYIDFFREQGIMTGITGPESPISISTRFWYNNELNFKFYMAPGILGVLVTMVGMFLTALNIVREKESGTIEQINVTPVVRLQFILGKLFPLWSIALFELGFGLVIIKFLYNVPMEGSILLLFGFVATYLLLILAFGLLMSTMADNQLQVMFLAYFFLVVFILMSGIFTPVESMPDWAQKVNIMNPMSYFIRVVRMILLKGSGIRDILADWISVAVYGSIMLMFAVLRYRKVS